MTASDIIKILQKLPQNAMVSFLCPDGYEDVFESFEVFDNGDIMFIGPR